MQENATISTAIWFDNKAEEAITFYTTIFPNSKLNFTSAVVTDAIICGISFTGINGGPMFKPNPSISFMVILEDKEDIDAIWKSLSPTGKILIALDQYPWSEHYGWVEDQYGVSCQIIPKGIEKLIQSPSASAALMKMGKIIIDDLK